LSEILKSNTFWLNFGFKLQEKMKNPFGFSYGHHFSPAIKYFSGLFELLSQKFG
jgi:hypothetical protein